MDKHDLAKRYQAEKRYQTYKTTQKSPILAVLFGIVFPPAGYLYMEQWIFAVINILTANYLMLGSVLVPAHCYLILRNARKTFQDTATT